MYRLTPSCFVSASTTTAVHSEHGSLTILKASPNFGKDGIGGAMIYEKERNSYNCYSINVHVSWRDVHKIDQLNTA